VLIREGTKTLLKNDGSTMWRRLSHGMAGYGYLHKVRVRGVEQLVRASRRWPPAAPC